MEPPCDRCLAKEAKDIRIQADIMRKYTGRGGRYYCLSSSNCRLCKDCRRELSSRLRLFVKRFLNV
jgi:hypothetical protein